MSDYNVSDFVSAEDRARFAPLAEKPASSLHEALAQYIIDVSGIEITEKQVQAVLSIHGTFQKSEANKNRAGYKARTIQSIRNGGETTRENMEKRLAALAAEDQPAAEKVLEELAEAVEEAPKEEKKATTKRAPAKSSTPATRRRRTTTKKETASA